MKNFYHLLLLLFLAPSAQAAAPLDAKITLCVSNRPLSVILDSVSRQSGLRFSYSSSAVDVSQAFSLCVKNRPAEEVLQLLLKDRYEYKLMRRYIILQKSQVKIVPVQNRDNQVKKEELDYITNQVYVKNLCYTDSGTVLGSCLSAITIKNDEAMKKRLAILMLATATTASAQAQAQDSTLPDSVRPILFSIFYPFSYPDLHAEKYTYKFSFNLYAGYNGGVTGCELGAGANINRHTMSGVQIAGAVNASFGRVTGVQIANFVNFAAKDTAAAQLSGVVNVAQSSRFQGAGIANAAYGNGQVQLAGISNLSVKGNSAAQLAGIANAAMQANVQISGIANASGGNNAVQISGIANAADTSNCQLGLVNVARKAGTQVGLINVCDTSSGVMIGLVNVAHRGSLRQLEVSSSSQSVNVAGRMGTKKFYTFLELSHCYENSLWMHGIGFGTQVELPKKFGMNVEALFQNVSDKPFVSEDFNGLSQLRVVLYKQLAKHFSLFTGPVLYVYNSEHLEDGKSINFKVPSYSIYSDKGGRVSTDVWLGVTAGVRF